MLHDFKKPLYSIYPRIYCSGVILVNDVPVVDWYGNETKEGGYGGDTMINQAILESGKYQVVGKMFPRNGDALLTEEELLSIDFFCAEKNEWKASRFEFHPRIESPWDGLSENIKYPYYEIKTEIEVEVPYKIDGWQSSMDFRDFDESKLFDEVFGYYKEIHSILKEHNTAKYLDLSSEKMKIQEEVFYFENERKASFIAGANQLFSQNLNVEDLFPENMKIEIIGNGKLVRLMNQDGSQPLQFITPNIEKQNNIELEVKLHMRNKEMGLTII